MRPDRATGRNTDIMLILPQATWKVSSWTSSEIVIGSCTSRVQVRDSIRHDWLMIE